LSVTRSLLYALSACLSLVVGCTGTETGNPSFEGELAYDAYSSEPAIAALREGEQGAVVTQAWLVLGDVTFIDNNHCGAPETAHAHADALGAGDHAPKPAARTRFRLPIGEYCGLRLPLLRAKDDAALPDGAPDELREHSIMLVGELPEQGGTPFAIESKLERTLFLTADHSSFELGPDDARVLLGFDVAAWLDRVELSAQEPGDDGRVLVSDDSHPELLQRFEDNIAQGVDVFLDPDGAGRFEDAGARLAHAE
jgi:hypothetical protein